MHFASKDKIYLWADKKINQEILLKNLTWCENLRIFFQIGSIIQTSFLTFFVMYYGVYLFWFFYTLGKRLHYSRNLTDNFKNYSLWGWNVWNFPSNFNCNTGLFFDSFYHLIVVYICVCFFTTPCHNFLVINFFWVYVIMPSIIVKMPPPTTGHESSVIDDFFLSKGRRYSIRGHFAVAFLGKHSRLSWSYFWINRDESSVFLAEKSDFLHKNTLNDLDKALIKFCIICFLTFWNLKCSHDLFVWFFFLFFSF